MTRGGTPELPHLFLCEDLIQPVPIVLLTLIFLFEVLAIQVTFGQVN